MSSIYEAFVTVEGGKLDNFNRSELQRALRSYSGPAELIIRRPRRNSQRNRRLHAVIGEVAAELGWETEDLKEELIKKLRPLDEDPVTGFIRRQRTRDMSDREVDALIEEIQAWTLSVMPGFVFREL